MDISDIVIATGLPISFDLEVANDKNSWEYKKNYIPRRGENIKVGNKSI